MKLSNFQQQEISQRYQEFKCEESKILITNVDVQASLNNVIVIQSMGEITNKVDGPLRFVQTFILAEQEGRFHILNDIFRYLSSKVVTASKVPAATTTVKPIPVVAKEPAVTAAPATATTITPVKAEEEKRPVVNEIKEEKKVATESKTNEAAPATESKSNQPKTWATMVSSNNSKWGSNSNTPNATSASSTGTNTPSAKPSTVSPVDTTAATSATFGIYFKLNKETSGNSNIKKVVHDTFSIFGTIKNVDVKNGVGSVEFVALEASNKALAQAKFNILGESVTVENKQFKPAHSRQNSSQTVDKRNNNYSNAFKANKANEGESNTTENKNNSVRRNNNTRNPQRNQRSQAESK
ncbi:NTF2-domain-containing protein [Neoconidiobolus thromboides FSU 785]|nr:NTF2-domain-containing protein [Neoconidiobolus thromboides FSU 785]